MSGELEKFDENTDNPFDLMAMLGHSITAQGEEDFDYFDEEDENDDDLDGDVYWVNVWMFKSRAGDWGQFADGLTWDGSRDLSDEPWTDELSLYEHVHLVMDSRREERRNSQSS